MSAPIASTRPAPGSGTIVDRAYAARLRLGLLALTIAASSGAACGSDDPATEPSVGRVEISTEAGTIAFSVEIADSDSERQRGLMGRTELAEGTGMVFLFDEPTTTRFWMKDTLIPLSIAFWDEGGTIVEVLDMQPCAEEPCPTYGPGRPYVAAVEVPLGELDEVSAGDLVTLQRN